MLEEEATDTMLGGFAFEQLDQRITRPGITDGGSIERAEAERLVTTATSIKLEFPKVNSALLVASQYYLAEAERHDEEAHQTVIGRDL